LHTQHHAGGHLAPVPIQAQKKICCFSLVINGFIPFPADRAKFFKSNNACAADFHPLSHQEEQARGRTDLIFRIRNA